MDAEILPSFVKPQRPEIQYRNISHKNDVPEVQEKSITNKSSLMDTISEHKIIVVIFAVIVIILIVIIVWFVLKPSTENKSAEDNIHKSNSEMAIKYQEMQKRAADMQRQLQQQQSAQPQPQQSAAPQKQQSSEQKPKHISEFDKILKNTDDEELTTYINNNAKLNSSTDIHENKSAKSTSDDTHEKSENKSVKFTSDDTHEKSENNDIPDNSENKKSKKNTVQRNKHTVTGEDGQIIDLD